MELTGKVLQQAFNLSKSSTFHRNIIIIGITSASLSKQQAVGRVNTEDRGKTS